MNQPDEGPEDTQRIRAVGIAKPMPFVVPRLSNDLHEALGQVMVETVKLGRRVDGLAQQIETQARELNGARRDIELDRRALVRGASRSAATRAGNRVAALMGTLFIVYEQAAPFLRALWRGLHR